MTTKAVRKRMKTRLDMVWRRLDACKSIWPTEQTYRDAIDLYHKDTKDLVYKFKACILIMCNDMGSEVDDLLPELAYLTMIHRHRIRSAKKLMKRIIKENVPFEPEVFSELCWYLFDTKVTCINACPKEV